MQRIIEKAKKIIREKPELFAALEEFDRTGKLKKLKYKERATFTVDEELMMKFRSYCEKNNMKMSSVVEDMIKNKVKDE